MTKEELYDEQINPLMAQIIDLCKAYDIPFLCSFQLATKEEDVDGEYFCTSALVPEWSSNDLKEAVRVIAGPKEKSIAFTIVSRQE